MNNENIKEILKSIGGETVPADVQKLAQETSNNFSKSLTLEQQPRQRILLEYIMRSKLPKYSDLPVTLLGRLAVDKTLRRPRNGEELLMHAFYNSYKIASRVVASMAIVVDPIDEEAKSYYLNLLKHYFQ